MTTPFDENSRFVRNPDLVSADMDGDLVMMSIENGEYYGIGGVGSRIWELLEQPVSLGQITETITSEFDVEADRCRADAIDFAKKLIELGLIKAA